MESDVTVVIPVGPSGEACTYLKEAIASVRAQTVQPAEILLIDDMHLLVEDCWGSEGLFDNPVRVWQSPWRLGVPGAFNAGVGLARTEHVLMLGADDWLEPSAIAKFMEISSWDAPEARGRTWYNFGVRYSDTDEVQWEPNNCAIVSKTLWRETGGFPPESAVGACDTILLSMIWNRDEFRRKRIGDQYLYNYRRWESTDSATRPVSWQGVIFSARDILTQTWKRPDWGRYCALGASS